MRQIFQWAMMKLMCRLCVLSREYISLMDTQPQKPPKQKIHTNYDIKINNKNNTKYQETEFPERLFRHVETHQISLFSIRAKNFWSWKWNQK